MNTSNAPNKTTGFGKQEESKTTALQAGKIEGFEKSNQPPKASHDDLSDYSDEFGEGSP